MKAYFNLTKYNMNTKLKAWNIKQLFNSMQEDLTHCHDDFERAMCETICKKEIREKAKEFAKSRKLNPVEIAILNSL